MSAVHGDVDWPWSVKAARWPGECGICRCMYDAGDTVVVHPEHRTRHMKCHLPAQFGRSVETAVRP